MQKLEKKVDKLEKMLELFMREMLDFKLWASRMIEEGQRRLEEHKKETDRQIRENNKRWGELANKLGTIVEDIIYPAFRPVIRKYFGCEPEKTFMRLEYSNRQKGIYEEFDAVAVCEDKVFLLEVKSTPREKHIEEFKEKAKRFLQYFPEFAGKRLILIMASLSFNEDFIKQLSKANIYAMAYREWEYMDILNFEEVKDA